MWVVAQSEKIPIHVKLYICQYSSVKQWFPHPNRLFWMLGGVLSSTQKPVLKIRVIRPADIFKNTCWRFWKREFVDLTIVLSHLSWNGSTREGTLSNNRLGGWKYVVTIKRAENFNERIYEIKSVLASRPTGFGPDLYWSQFNLIWYSKSQSAAIRLCCWLMEFEGGGSHVTLKD